MTDTKQETQTWWRVQGEDIEPQQVLRFTEKTVTFWDAWNERERRSNRASSWERWFNSEAEAVEHVRTSLARRELNARLTAEHLAERLAAFNEAHPLPATEEHDG